MTKNEKNLHYNCFTQHISKTFDELYKREMINEFDELESLLNKINNAIVANDRQSRIDNMLNEIKQLSVVELIALLFACGYENNIENDIENFCKNIYEISESNDDAQNYEKFMHDMIFMAKH